jgi:hypothetical protein
MRRSPGVFDRATPLLALLPFLLVAQAPILALWAQSTDNSLEYQVKAAMIYNFTKFIEWPPAPGEGGADSRFEICMLGDRDVLDVMRRTVRGKLVRGSAVAIRAIGDSSEAAGCELIFVTQASGPRSSAGLAAARAGTLTIAEAADLGQSGAMINLILDEGRVGFQIDVDRANQAGLKISSNLLKLARTSTGEGRR